MSKYEMRYTENQPKKNRLPLLAGTACVVVMVSVFFACRNNEAPEQLAGISTGNLVAPRINGNPVDAETESILATKLPGDQKAIDSFRGEIMNLKPIKVRADTKSLIGRKASEETTSQVAHEFVPATDAHVASNKVRRAKPQPQTLITVSEITYIEVLDKNNLIVFYGIVRPDAPKVIGLRDGDIRVRSQKPSATSINGRPHSDKPFEISRN